MKTSEDYFKMGASAMRSKIVAFLVMKGNIDIAPKILDLKLPTFQEPEKITIKEKKGEKP